jgi:hypothetical protein
MLETMTRESGTARERILEVEQLDGDPAVAPAGGATSYDDETAEPAPELPVSARTDR